jgi:hypothetical protein
MIKLLFYYHKKMLHNLSPISTDIHCNLVFNKYQTQPQFLDHISLIIFFTKNNIKIYKRYKHSEIINWVSFNLHKDPKNHYKKILLLFKLFCEIDVFLKNFVFHGMMCTLIQKMMFKKTPKKLYIISIKMVNVIMNDIICNHKYTK